MHYLVIASYTDYGGEDGMFLEDVEADSANNAVAEVYDSTDRRLREAITDMTVLTIQGGEAGWDLPAFNERPWWRES